MAKRNDQGDGDGDAEDGDGDDDALGGDGLDEAEEDALYRAA